MSKFNVGDKVRYIGNRHEGNPDFYPTFGTVGLIEQKGFHDCLVRWEKDSTSLNDCWYCEQEELALVDVKEETHSSEIPDITNEEIWKMLESKMRKNGLISKANLIHVSADNYPNNEVKITKTYLEDDVHNAIALAYKVGYFRSQKGRPFKIGSNKIGHSEPKKEKTGHWVPVDIEQVSKGAYKVVEDCSGWHYEYLGTYRQDEDGKIYQWVEDDE